MHAHCFGFGHQQSTAAWRPALSRLSPSKAWRRCLFWDGRRIYHGCAEAVSQGTYSIWRFYYPKGLFLTWKVPNKGAVFQWWHSEFNGSSSIIRSVVFFKGNRNTFKIPVFCFWEGSAATGIADLMVDAFMAEGLTTRSWGQTLVCGHQWSGNQRT